MTIAKRHKLADLSGESQFVTLAEDFVASGRQYLEELSRTQWPSPKYRGRYVEFAHDILGIELWSLDPSINDPESGGQVEICEACAKYERVAVASGQKIGKTTVEAVIALCDYCSYDDMRVIMTATTGHQVDEVFWRELMIRRTRAGKCVACLKADPYDKTIPRPCPHSAFIDGDMGQKARTGLKSGFREIYGLTANEGEALLGISGANMRFIVDEASGVRDAIMRGLDGNRAGGASFLMFGNPTKNEGYFFDAFHEKSKFWRTFNISSEHNPNALSGEKLVPGLATRAYIDERKEEWGEKSPEFTIKIRGRFAVHEAGCVFSIHAIGEAEARWAETPAEGRLYVGVDPAGPTGSGDESCFVVRRGKKMIEMKTMRGLNDDQHLVQILLLIGKYKIPGEIKPVVVVDRGGVGLTLCRLLDDHVDRDDAFELVGLIAQAKAVRQPQIYDRVRDELAANLEVWMREGGAIVTDVKLEKELHALTWSNKTGGQVKLIPKDAIRKQLGRSPDRYDALALSVWEPLELRDENNPATRARADARAEQARTGTEDLDELAELNPYAAGARFWEGR